MIADFVPDLLDGLFVESVQSLGEVLAEHGMHVLLGHFQYDPLTEEALVSAPFALGRKRVSVLLRHRIYHPARCDSRRSTGAG